MRPLILLLVLLGFGTAVPSVGGADPADGHVDHHHAVSKVIVVDHDHREIKFDLSKPDEKKAFLKRVESGDFHSIHEDAPPEIIPKRWDTGVWSVVIFVTLYLVLKKFAWTPMLQGLKKREDTIRSALEQAEQTRRQALELQGQLDEKLRNAGAEVARMMEEARRDAAALKEQMIAEARQTIQQDRDRQLREIQLARESALHEIRQQAVALAVSITRKVVRRDMSEADHRNFLDEALAELERSPASSLS
ncbi:MAG: F0F1 ATP synthase subunit B [Gemmataceae bacterium]|nr:F0F1 ATP synthase subunit B [Gemmataceae bacterium]